MATHCFCPEACGGQNLVLKLHRSQTSIATSWSVFEICEDIVRKGIIYK